MRLDLDDELASRAVWFLYIYPTAYFLHIGYTEALFLALTLATFLAARPNGGSSPESSARSPA